jgi:recombination protein RecR
MIVRDVQDPLERLVRLLTKMPGIGERTARRLAFHVLRAPAEYPEDLAHALMEIRGTLLECTSCGNISEDEVCPICSDGSRDPKKLCIVASIQDLQVIERSGSYRGRYFVLHGYIAPLDGLNPEDLDTDRLLSLVRDNGVREVILATNPTVEGEATAGYLAQRLRDEGVRITRIASGIQHGAEIEYSDPVSVARAIDRRDEY